MKLGQQIMAGRRRRPITVGLVVVGSRVDCNEAARGRLGHVWLWYIGSTRDTSAHKCNV
jgi:hypothetical protein